MENWPSNNLVLFYVYIKCIAKVLSRNCLDLPNASGTMAIVCLCIIERTTFCVGNKCFLVIQSNIITGTFHTKELASMFVSTWHSCLHFSQRIFCVRFFSFFVVSNLCKNMWVHF